MKKNNVRKRELSEDETRDKSSKNLATGAIAMLIMVIFYLIIIGDVMVRFSGKDIPMGIIIGISIMSILGYMFGLIEDIKEIEPKNDFKNSNIMVLSIFRGARYAFWVAFAAYTFVFQFFDLPLLIK